jgi:hypothetical protein
MGLACRFLAQLCFNHSLLLTSVTSNSILSTSSSIFTFALSVWLVNERLGLADIARHFIGCHSTQGTGLQNALDDDTWQMLSGRCRQDGAT